MGQVLDLNARRAARSEAENTPHEVALGFDADGKPRVFQLKPRMPLEVADLLRESRMREAMELLLVDPDDWAELRKAAPDNEDLEAIAELYAVSVPESGGSPASLSNGGPTSNATLLSATDLISRTPAMVDGLSGSAGSSPSSGGSPRSPARPARSTERRGGTGKS